MSKRYTVTGTQPVLDHKPGESFEAEIPAEQERFLVGIGALAIDKAERRTKSHKRNADRR